MTRRITLVGLIAGGRSGIPRYAAALTAAVGRVASEFPLLEITAVTTEAGAAAIGRTDMPVRIVNPRALDAREGPARIALEQWHAARANGQLLHFFDVVGPLLAPGKPFTATVHDLGVMRSSRVGRKSYKRLVYPWAFSRAKALVAVSEFARREAVHHFATQADKIHVIRSGPGFLPLGTHSGDGAGDRALPAGDFLLYVGNLASGKNLPFLVRAFARSGLRLPLLLVGRRGDDYEELARTIASVRPQAPVQIVDDASDETVDALYRRAVALVLPSTYEGFAFTPLEAMARGCAVVASDIPAVQEISGDGAMLLPPADEERWADALRRVFHDHRLRAELRERGSAVVARYSWERTARGVCALFFEATA